jgi:GMP synthase PP-ATPase subunit
VLGNVIASNVVAVGNVTGVFVTAANIGTRVNIASMTSGVSTTTANVLTISTLGSVFANGNVVLSSTPLLRSNIWEQFGTTLQNSNTVGAQFIRAEPSYIP